MKERTGQSIADEGVFCAGKTANVPVREIMERLVRDSEEQIGGRRGEADDVAV